jgi:hypothetical protein
MAAAIALVAVPTQCRSPASFDRVEHLYLWPGEAFFKAKHEPPARFADDSAPRAQRAEEGPMCVTA